MRQYLAAFVIFATLAPFSLADGQQFIQSQEGIALQNEILQLQSQVQGLQANGGGGGGGGGGSSLGGSAPPPSDGAPAGGGVVTSLLTQVQQLQAQVQELSGKVDTLQNEVNQQHDATEKEIGDLNFKLTGGAAAAGTAGAGQLAPTGGQQQAAAPPDAGHETPDTAPPAAQAAVPATLHDAQAAYAAHNYAGAEAAGRAVVAKGGPGAYPAQYVVAESLAAEGKPQDAAIAYDDAYNKNRSGTYAAPSLLGLATALANIHQEKAACSTLSSLNSQFPTPPAGLAPRIEALSHRAHCG